MAEKLTVLIPCKDERLNIRPCIESVRSVADEILIADSGSTDGTLDIVRSLGGCRIIEREYVNSANFKNWSIPQAKYRWLLIVDADERVTPALAHEINQVKADPPQNLDGYWIGREGYYLGYPIRHCGWDRDDVIRLFRRDAGRYAERWVHAQVQLPRSRTSRLKHPLLHYTAWTSDHHLKKHLRYADWGARNLRNAGRRPSVWSMLTRVPTRFLQLYLLRLGFLDGVPGLQVCMITAFYAFLKQIKLWEMERAIRQPDPEAQRVQGRDDAGDEAAQILPMRALADERSAHADRYRRAAGDEAAQILPLRALADERSTEADQYRRAA